MTPPDDHELPVTPGPGAVRRVTPRPAGKRRKFDKATSTTVLLAVLVGLGAGAVGRLLATEPLTGSGAEPALAEQTAAPTKVIVIDAAGRVLAIYDDASLVPVNRSGQSLVTLARGPARAAAASTRAS